MPSLTEAVSHQPVSPSAERATPMTGSATSGNERVIGPGFCSSGSPDSSFKQPKQSQTRASAGAGRRHQLPERAFIKIKGPGSELFGNLQIPFHVIAPGNAERCKP